MKTCTKCKSAKAEEEFGRDEEKRDRLRSRCKECANADNCSEKVRARRRARYHADLERSRAKQRANTELSRRIAEARADPALRALRRRERRARYFAANRDQILQQARAAAKLASARLTSAFVARALEGRIRDFPKALIDLKREQLQLHRLAKQLKQAATTTTKDQHEAKPEHP
jgi:hypothetical protein